MPSALFVYGTLKHGERNFFVSQQAGWVRSEWALVEGFALYHFPTSVLRPYSYPALIEGAGRVQGEVQWFANLQGALKVLDQLEDEGGEYRRIKASAQTKAGTEQVWVYVYSNPQALAEAGAIPVAAEIWRPEDFIDDTGFR
jgi:gamma-glutamylcyclotransferase (GGCT)/AIG2-like uncharacterized protein YtfP